MSEALGRLFGWPDALEAGPEADGAFLDAMQMALAHHYARSQAYRDVCEAAGFTPAMLRAVSDLPRVPWLDAGAFASGPHASLPEDKIEASFVNARGSLLAWDRPSLARWKSMREKLVEAYGLSDKLPVNYLCLGHDEDSAVPSGATHCQSEYMRFAPSHEVFCGVHADASGKVAFDARECVEALKRFARQPLPVRVTGCASFTWKVLKAVKKGGKSLLFDPRSLILHGPERPGEEAVEHEACARAAEECLGIPRTRVRRVFTLVEHGVPYITCERGGFHVPVFARVFARKPGTLDLLPEGESGLLHALSPYNWAQPALSLLFGERAAVASGCPCGRPGLRLVPGA